MKYDTLTDKPLKLRVIGSGFTCYSRNPKDKPMLNGLAIGGIIGFIVGILFMCWTMGIS